MVSSDVKILYLKGRKSLGRSDALQSRRKCVAGAVIVPLTP